jgi:hypothetical protein
MRPGAVRRVKLPGLGGSTPADQADEWQVLVTGDVGETTVATPVCVDVRIFLRTHESLL